MTRLVKVRAAARQGGLERGATYGGLAGSVVILGAVLAGWQMGWQCQAALAAVLALQFSTIARLLRPWALVISPPAPGDDRMEAGR